MSVQAAEIILSLLVKLEDESSQGLHDTNAFVATAWREAAPVGPDVSVQNDTPEFASSRRPPSESGIAQFRVFSNEQEEEINGMTNRTPFRSPSFSAAEQNSGNGPTWNASAE